MAEWTDRLVAVYAEARGEPYAHGGAKDAQAVKRMISYAGGDLTVAEARWLRALGLGNTWPGCATLASLAAKWNDLGSATPENEARRPHRDAWEGRSPGAPGSPEWPEPTEEQRREWDRKAWAEQNRRTQGQ